MNGTRDVCYGGLGESADEVHNNNNGDEEQKEEEEEESC